MVKISVIMPVYNGAEFLQKSIESISKQTLKDLELICVDDGSTDNSIDVLNSLSKKYDFIKIITQENNGSGSARNNGIKNAVGEYIAFLDADDIFIDESALEIMYNQAKKNNANIVSANLKFIESDYTISDNPHYNDGDYAKFEDYGKCDSKDYGIPYAFYKNIFNKEFLNKFNIRFPDLLRGQDPIFMAKSLVNSPEIFTVPFDLYGYNHSVGGGVNIKINTPEKKHDYIQHFKDTIDILEKGNFKDVADFYKIHLFRFLTFDDNNYDAELIELFDEFFGLDNLTFDETDFNYVRFMVPACFYFINKNASEEFYRKVNKKFLTFNIYDTFAITEDIIDKYLLVVYSYSFEDFRSNYDKYLMNNLKFKDEFMKFKVEKFIFNHQINPSKVVLNNTKMIIQNNSVFKNKLIKKGTLKKIYNIKFDENFKNSINLSLQNQVGVNRKQNIINKLKNGNYSDITIAIKSPNPKGHHHWGDYFFSLSLKKSFEKKGFKVIIQELDDWYDSVKVDITIVLRGTTKYTPNSDELNIMWNISHPDMIGIEEYELYDICFIASKKHCDMIDSEVNTITEVLFQCTDPEIFFFEKDESLGEDILFVGVTRGVYREIIRDIMQTDYDVSIYGLEWENFIDERYIKGQFIPNKELHKYYSSSKIILNDHWEDMRACDFPSNRIFDALACGSLVISDKIPSAFSLFEGCVITYDNVDDLNKKVKYFLTHDDERKRLAEKGKEIVLKNHTFDKRCETIINCLKNLY